MKANIVWLASYPKSGNTWFRTFLTALLKDEQQGVDINHMLKTTIASSRELFEEYTEIESSDLTHTEIDLLRPDIYVELSNSVVEPTYMKVHDAFTKNRNDEWLLPPEATKGAIYFVRNPLDVVVSFAHHSAWSIQESLKTINDEQGVFCGGRNRLKNQLRQRLLSWSSHVASWINAPCPVCLLRYEDMKRTPLDTFRKAVDFLELNKSDDEILKALDGCSFEKLQAQEKESGFKEKAQNSESFFRKGIIGDWENYLTEPQIKLIIETHRDIMQEMGYLDKNNRLRI